MRRVVVTGIGLQTPLGSDPEGVLDALLAGRSAVRAHPEWADAVEGLGSLVGADIPSLDARRIPRKARRTMGRVAQLAALAAQDAVGMAGLERSDLAGCTVAMGSTLGSSQALETFWRRYLLDRKAGGLKAGLFFQVMSHTCAANVAMYLGAGGEVMSTNAACASGTQAIGAALHLIRGGRYDVAIAGGADELHPAAALTFDHVGGASRAFNDRPHRTPRPFDADRDGVVVAEGAGVLVLEERERALARGATILGEVLAYEGTCEAVSMSSPDPSAMIRCMRGALDAAGLPPDELVYGNAHATGTRIGDATEAAAWHALVGDRVPISSFKGHFGHMQGACGAVEAALCLLALRRGVAPPTLNLEAPDVAPIHLPTAPTPIRPGPVLSTSFAFGGVNACLVLGPA